MIMNNIWSLRKLSFVLLLTLLLPVGMTSGYHPAILEPVTASAAGDRHVEPNSHSLEFAGGTGTEVDPYLVANAEQLNNVRNHLDAHFRQTADIDLGVVPWNTGEGWVPIGSAWDDSFTGTYDGGGYVIRNLTINRPDAIHQGLFGYAGSLQYASDAAILRHLHLQDVKLRVGGGSGALVGNISGGLLGGLWGGIDDVSVSGTIETESLSSVGGLVGTASSPIHGAFANVEVWGRYWVGGLAGRASEVRHSYSVGAVHGEHYVGGLVGSSGPGGVIADSYSRASVTGINAVGGLVGENNIPIYRSYSTGRVAATGDDVGGLVGTSDYAVPVADAYWDIETSEQTDSAAGVGRTTQEMQRRATYETYNFRSLWTVSEGNDYPFFLDLSAYPRLQTVHLDALGGAGTIADPYQITNANELHAVRQDPGANYILMNDIDMTATLVWDFGRGWQPIAGTDRPVCFAGMFEGGGHTIRHMTINRPRTSNLGLFRCTSDAYVHNLQLLDARLYTGGYSGTLAGSASEGTIEDIQVSGEIWATGDSTGGLVGSSFSDLIRVQADVTISGADYVGGVAGSSDSGEIHQASALGSIHGSDAVGGLIGHCWLGDLGRCVISDSYSRASVEGHNHVGGLVGLLSSSSILRSYSAGLVIGTGDGVGGLVGSIEGESTSTEVWDSEVSSSYWDIETSSQSTSAGGTARTTAQMTYPYAEDTFVDWDFNNVWAEDHDSSRNEGYPYLVGTESPGVRVRIIGQRGITPGEVVDYAIRYANGLDYAMEDPVLILRLPHLATYRHSSTGGIYWPQRDVVFWRLADLEPEATGIVSVRVEYEWGIPDGVEIDLAALMVGSNYNADAAELTPYLNYMPLEATSTEGLSHEEWEGAAMTVPDLDALYSDATDAGYLWGAGERVSLSDGTTALQAVLIEPEQQSVRMLLAVEDRALVATFDHDLFTLADTTGGMEWEFEIDEHSFWGEWADIAGAAEPDPSGMLGGCGMEGESGCCLENCLTEAALKAIVGRLSRLLKSALTAIDCSIALTSFEPDAIAGCASSVQKKLPFLSETVSIINCLVKCRDNPDGYACEADKILCRSHYPIDVYRPFVATQWTYHCEDGCYSRRPTAKPCAMNECCVPGRGCVLKSVAALSNPADVCSTPRWRDWWQRLQKRRMQSTQ